MSNGIILDYISTNIDELITTTENMIADLEGEEGAMLISESKSLIRKKLSGKYKDSLENSLINVEESYMHSIANVKALNMVLREYKAITDSGTNNQVKRNSNVISVDFDSLYQQITNLKTKIEDENILKSIIENDSDFDTWITNYNASLDDSIKSTYEVDSEGNMTEAGMWKHLQDQKKEKMFRTNAKLFGELDVKLANAFTATTGVVQGLEVTAGVLSGNLTDFSSIWEVFDFTKSDYQNYLVAHFDGLTQEDMNDLKTDITNGDIESVIDDVIDIINDMLDEQSTSQDAIEVIANLQTKLARTMINDYKMNRDLSGDYTEILQLLAAITYVFQYYPYTVINSGTYSTNTVSVVGLEYKNGMLTLTLVGTDNKNYTWTEEVDVSDVDFGDTSEGNNRIRNDFTENYNGTLFSLLGIAATYVPGGQVGNFANLTASVDAITSHNTALSTAIREEIVNTFGGHSATGQDSYPDASTVLAIYIANDLGIVDISDENPNISNFLKLSEEEQEERLVDLCSNDSSEIHDWLNEPVDNPRDDTKKTTRDLELTYIRGVVDSWVMVND